MMGAWKQLRVGLTRISPLGLLLLVMLIFAPPTVFGASPAASQSGRDAKLHDSTADHRKFKQLKGPFEIEEITKACLECHTEASDQIHRTLHWTWEFSNPRTGQVLGKRNVLGNFFPSVKTNLGACTVCHTGFGWVDEGFDFSAKEKVDCLICHDTTGKYAYERFHQEGNKCEPCHDKRPKFDRNRKPADLAELARAVGPTNRRTCGACHFHEGGDGAKHGDLSSALAAPARDIDVHMDANGLNFSCAKCHRSAQHHIMGSRYLPMPSDPLGIDSVNGSRATCQSCHGSRPMKDERLNEHADKIACQTCHIPTIARGGIATRTHWDWSSAGKRGRKGKVRIKRNKAGQVTYVTQMGSFTWQENLKPEYLWFNGTVAYNLPGDKIEPSPGPVRVNSYLGGPDDPSSRIFPVKIMRGKQLYDTENKLLVTPHLVGRDRDAYWTSYKWDRAAKAGMEARGLPFSGKTEFVETAMIFPVTHMVAPVEEALACDSCHARPGLLANVKGIYIPGRDGYKLLDLLGFAMILATLAGVLFHGFLRLVFGQLARFRR